MQGCYGVTSRAKRKKLGVNLQDDYRVYNFYFAPYLKEEKIRLSSFHSSRPGERYRVIIGYSCDNVNWETLLIGCSVAENGLFVIRSPDHRQQTRKKSEL